MTRVAFQGGTWSLFVRGNRAVLRSGGREGPTANILGHICFGGGRNGRLWNAAGGERGRRLGRSIVRAADGARPAHLRRGDPPLSTFQTWQTSHAWQAAHATKRSRLRNVGALSTFQTGRLRRPCLLCALPKRNTFVLPHSAFRILSFLLPARYHSLKTPRRDLLLIFSLSTFSWRPLREECFSVPHSEFRPPRSQSPLARSLNSLKNAKTAKKCSLSCSLKSLCFLEAFASLREDAFPFRILRSEIRIRYSTSA